MARNLTEKIAVKMLNIFKSFDQTLKIKNPSNLLKIFTLSIAIFDTFIADL